MKFNFTSQICTTKEQSERLLALGLKADTADMRYILFEGDLEPCIGLCLGIVSASLAKQLPILVFA